MQVLLDDFSDAILQVCYYFLYHSKENYRDFKIPLTMNKIQQNKNCLTYSISLMNFYIRFILIIQSKNMRTTLQIITLLQNKVTKKTKNIQQNAVLLLGSIN